MRHLKIQTFICTLVILLAHLSLFGQTKQLEMMDKLSFMIGEWTGTSKSYQNDTVFKQIPAFEKISYNLDKHIITIDLKSETLQLHTVIYYDEKDEKYYYNVFYQGGVGKYTGEYTDGKFVVSPTENKRFIFQLTPEGYFQEYGENLKNGKWVKYFEDTFKISSEK